MRTFYLKDPARPSCLFYLVACLIFSLSAWFALLQQLGRSLLVDLKELSQISNVIEMANDALSNLPCSRHSFNDMAQETLVSFDLMPLIASFQDGIHHNMLPLVRERSDTVVQIFHEWINVHGDAWLVRLRACLPRLNCVILKHAVRFGYCHRIDTFEMNEFSDNLLQEAASAGQLQVIQHLLDRKYTSGIANAMEAAASNGHLRVVEFLHRHRSDRQTTRVMNAAAAAGHLDVVRFLHFYRREGCTTAAMDNAAANGHLHVVKFLFKYRDEGYTRSAIHLAAGNGHVDVVKWFVEKRGERWTSMTINNSAASGHVAVLAYLHSRSSRMGWTKQAMDIAATNGHLNVVKFFWDNHRLGCSKQALEGARRNGHASVVAFLERHSQEMIHSLCCACGFVKPLGHACSQISSICKA
ncbi:hypothetical protein AC1031_004465 [Aphanomyces cochlioides]|nr:hypothetical protein AC1031_004465 [Aphanomyces cochlioides]